MRRRSSSKSGSVTSSVSATGRVSTAMSMVPESSWSWSAEVVASCTTTRTRGWRWAIVSTSAGTSQRAVVPMTPMRPTPATSSRTEATSAARASSSAWMRRARSTTTAPSSVTWPVARSMRVTPSSFSSRATWVDTLDCTVCRARAAAEKPPWSTTASTALSWRRSIAADDGTYRKQLLDRWASGPAY